uniref:Uncharacterized protein n=1 Tax=Globodera rostochiensis TaxID=31243 RepID=A0A914HXG5_GLORO
MPNPSRALRLSLAVLALTSLSPVPCQPPLPAAPAAIDPLSRNNLSSPPPTAASSSSVPNDVSPLLFQNTNAGNAGIFVRLMPTGLAYLREIGMKVVNDEILKISLPTITEAIDAGQYWPPVDYTLDLITPDTFTWRMSKMHLRSNGNFDARLNGALLLPTVPIQGEFEALLGHLGLTISVRMLSEEARAERLNGVITDFFINTFKAFLIAHFKPTVEQRICQMIEGVINGDMNAVLATMPLKVHINEDNLDLIGKNFGIAPEPTKNLENNSQRKLKAPRNFTLLNFVSQLRDRNLVLDFALIDDPFVSQGTVLMKSRGEISFGGLGGTPFAPPNVIIPQPQGVFMAEFFGTDFVANSMLYHAFKHKYMDVVVGPESSPQLKDVLLTTCSSGFCIGEYLGSLGQQFPGRQVEIHFSAKKAPIMVFVEGRARFRLHGKMDLFVRPENASQRLELVLRSETTMTSNVNLWIERNQILGNATVENLDFKLVGTNVHDVEQSSFADLGLFGAEFLEKLLTEILQIGLLLPSMRGVVLRSPKLTVHDRYIRVQTYFKLDEQYAERLVQGAVRQTLLNIG